MNKHYKHFTESHLFSCISYILVDVFDQQKSPIISASNENSP